jgi:hypothetical protein
MVSGLWTVQFEAMGNRGAGVAVFTNGKVLGGDSGFTYTGTFHRPAIAVRLVFGEARRLVRVARQRSCCFVMVRTDRLRPVPPLLRLRLV